MRYTIYNNNKYKNYTTIVTDKQKILKNHLKPTNQNMATVFWLFLEKFSKFMCPSYVEWWAKRTAGAQLHIIQIQLKVFVKCKKALPRK